MSSTAPQPHQPRTATGDDARSSRGRHEAEATIDHGAPTRRDDEVTTSALGIDNTDTALGPEDAATPVEPEST